MSKITYQNKVALNENPSVADINKVKASDMNEIKSVINGINDGTDVVDNLVVGSVRTKNMFDSSTIIRGDIIGGYPNIRMSSRQALWLEPGTYTFSSNFSTGYRVGVSVQTVGPPPLSSYPTYEYDSGWQTTSPITFTISNPGYFSLGLSKTDNGTFSNTDIESLLGFNYQLEKGDTATTYSDYQNLEANANNINIYSKEERKIGTWIDGKPLYRKVIKVTSIDISSNNCDVAISISNLNEIVNIGGTIKITGTNTYKPITTIYTDSSSAVGSVFSFSVYAITDSYISLSYGNWWKEMFDKAYIILEYTKTTD